MIQEIIAEMNIENLLVEKYMKIFFPSVYQIFGFPELMFE